MCKYTISLKVKSDKVIRKIKVIVIIKVIIKVNNKKIDPNLLRNIRKL